jgi:nucleotide-binding universal stress UspA family protein
MSRKKILVPVDIHKDSTELLLYAGSLASTMQGRISCVAIMDDTHDSTGQENDLSIERRKVELELSKIVNENFKQGKPEFDIIVSKGEYSSRILQMTNDLGIDLMVVKAIDFDVLKPILAQIASAFIVVHNSKAPSKQLVLAVNLDASYYMIVQESIEIAQLLNANLKVISYTCSTTNEDKYKEKLYDIKNMVERENVACLTSFSKWNSKPGSFLEDLLLELDGELPLLTFDEMEELESITGLSEYLQSSNAVLVPTKKKYMQKAQFTNQLSYT